MPDSGMSAKKSFYGWNILILATVCQFVSVGFTVYLIGLYIEPLSATFSATPGQLGWASAIFMLVSSALGPLLGYWVDRGKVRYLLTSGAVLLAVGFVLLSQMQNILQAALICIFLIAPGGALLGMVTAGAMLVQWFERRRGLAIGVAAAGISLGGFAMPPIAAWLFSTFDWRNASLILGVVVAVVLVPMAWLVAVSKPADVGQFPDGDEAVSCRDSSQQTASSTGFGALVVRLDFWLIALTVGAVTFCSIMIITYLVPYSREQGIDMQSSAFMLSVYAGSAFCGKFLAGWLADRVAPRRILTGIALAMALGMLPMLYLEGLIFFPLSAGIVGFSVGGLMPVWASLIASNFGAVAFGRTKGAMTMALTGVSVLPGPLGGYLYDANGSYGAAFNLLIWVLLAGAVISLCIPKGSSE